MKPITEEGRVENLSPRWCIPCPLQWRVTFQWRRRGAWLIQPHRPSPPVGSKQGERKSRWVTTLLSTFIPSSHFSEGDNTSYHTTCLTKRRELAGGVSPTSEGRGLLLQAWSSEGEGIRPVRRCRAARPTSGSTNPQNTYRTHQVQQCV